MVLLNDVIHVLTGSTFAYARQKFVSLQVTDSSDVSWILVDIDYPWDCDMRSAQDFAEETLSCSSAPGLIQEKIECLTDGMSLDATLRYDSSIQT